MAYNLRRARYSVFIVKWEGKSPEDKAEWVATLREALSGELGSYLVRFYQAEAGWRFALEYRPDEQPPAEDVMTNGPESVAFNIHQLLSDRGKPIDPTWTP
jgi:hypothetical protein